MSTTDIAGPGGSVTLPSGMSAHISAWSATIELEDVETTGFVEIGNRSFVNTTVMLSGAAVGTGQGGAATASQLMQAAALGTAPAFTNYSGNITLTGGYGGTYSGTNTMNITFPANIKAIALNRAQNGKLDVAYTFKSSCPATSAGIVIVQP